MTELKPCPFCGNCLSYLINPATIISALKNGKNARNNNGMGAGNRP